MNKGLRNGLAAILAMTALPVAAAEGARAPFGAMPDGSPIEVVTLQNGHGVSARVINYGAILQSLTVPDRNGKKADIVLGYAALGDYLAKPNFFGATVGRYANRIANGSFELDGTRYQLALNNGPNTLHGGRVGFDKVVWNILNVSGGPTASVTLGYTSADGEEGFPGALTVTATYSLNEMNELSLTYAATTTKSTIVNLTNHSFFNLDGEGSVNDVLGERMMINADAITPIDKALIPMGEIRPVAGTPFDFRMLTAIGDHIRDGSDPQIVFGKGYDHNFVLRGAAHGAPRLAVRVEDPRSGRVLEMLTDQPGLQIYTGNFLDGSAIGVSKHAYRQSDGLAMEPQLFPDTPNHPEFGSARLDPGQTYRNLIVYRFSVMK